jgi:BASS family bile acid:Na+ symporter
MISNSPAHAISVEVGMQNSGLGTVLARDNFANPLVALSPAISAMSHCVIGSLAAALWSRRSPAISSEHPTQLTKVK